LEFTIVKYFGSEGASAPEEEKGGEADLRPEISTSALQSSPYGSLLVVDVLQKSPTLRRRMEAKPIFDTNKDEVTLRSLESVIGCIFCTDIAAKCVEKSRSKYSAGSDLVFTKRE
jgi:hypothetical protein